MQLVTLNQKFQVRKNKQYRFGLIVRSETQETKRSSDVQQIKPGRKAVIIGGGPVGLTCAMHMLKNGMQVEIYEKRSEPSLPEARNAKEFGVSINQRGLVSLTNAGFDVDENFGQINTYKQMITISDKKVEKGNRKGYYINRSEIVAILSKLIHTSPNKKNLKIFYNTTIENLDIKNKTIVFSDSSKKQIDQSIQEYQDNQENQVQNQNQIKSSYDLLIGADGSNSQVRDLLKQQCPEFDYQVEYTSKFIFRVATKLDPEDLISKMYNFGIENVYNADTGKILVNYSNKQSRSRSDSRLIAWTESDKTVSIMVYADADDPVLSSRETTPKIFKQYLQDRFGDFCSQAWINSASQQLAQNPVRKQGKLVRCNQFHGPGVILLGDAAHSITPLLGQGLNSGLEDCQVLTDLLSQNNQIPFEKIPEIYTQNRLLNIHAIQNFEGAIYKLVTRPPMDFYERIFQFILLPGLLVSIFVGTFLEPWQLGFQLQQPGISQNNLQQRMIAIGGFCWVSFFAGASLLARGLQIIPAF